MLSFGTFRLDVAGKRLWRESQQIALAPKALELLIYLVNNQGRVLTREQLFEAIWPNTFVDDHALSVQIRELRKALGDDPKSPRFIETRHRMGYCFLPEVRKDDEAAGDKTAAALSAATAAANAMAVAPAVVEAAEIPETHYTQSGDVNIAYQVVGDGPIDMVFVMGWISHLELFWTEPSFARFLKRLAKFSRLILFDKRGTGLSDRVPISQLPTLEQRMYDLRAVMDASKSERAVLCGVSEGGPMSAVFAATYPERTRALVMVNTYAKRIREDGYPWGPTMEQHEAFLREIRERWGGPVGIEDRAPSMANDPRLRDWWAKYIRTAASPGAAWALTKMNGEIDVRQALPSVRVPTLVLHRKGDRCLTVEEGRYVASLIPGSRFVELPGIDHLPFVGDQEPILDEIESFVANMSSAPEPERTLATVMEVEAVNARAEDVEPLADQIRHEVRWHRGLHIEIKGNRVSAVFDGPARAVRCACQLRDLAARHGLSTRSGLHTGECDTPFDQGIRGPAAEVAWGICSSSKPGEVLASSTVRDLVAGSGLNFGPMADLQIPGLGRDWRMFQVQR